MADYNDRLNGLERIFINSNRITKHSNYYNIYSLLIDNELSSITESREKISYIITNISECNKNITTIIGKEKTIDRKIIEIKIDVLRQKLEDIIGSDSINISDLDYTYYPHISNELFNLEIYKKLEFRRNESKPLKLNNPKTEGFQKSSTQKFAKNFISPFTPYNGVLLFHEVGVGKTCTALGIAEGFRDYLSISNKKILVLTPSETLIGNWKNEIFNTDIEIKKHNENKTHNVQCTGDRYINEIPNPEYEDKTRFKRQANKLISKYYEFMGYQKLANTIKNTIKKNTANRSKFVQAIIIDYIKERFSNTVIIMDEVHETRISDNKEKDKLVVPWLEMIARYAENTKIILLTATPMYNVSSEIVWLLNLLLLNDKRAPIEPSKIFAKDGIEFIDKSVDHEYFTKKTRGYISYVRGEDPVNFPIKIEPSGSVIPNSKYKIEKGRRILIKQDERSRLKNYPSPMSLWQFDQFSKNYYNTSTQSIDDIKVGFPVTAVQASNIIFPNPNTIGTELLGEVGKSSFDRCFVKSKKNYTINDKLVNFNGSGKSFIHRDNIQLFSSKFKTIIDSITKCEGIVFIFSDYLIQGVLTMALALEENGFDRLVYKDKTAKTENLLTNSSKNNNGFCAVNNKYYSQLSDSEKTSYKKAKYILLEGGTSKNELNALVNEVRGEGVEKNDNGEYVKVILGSEVVKQGISFKNVREVHILEPWFHLNEMKQASGRAVRRGSHLNLTEDKRNVSIFLHIATHPLQIDGYKGPDVELVDEKTYRKSFDKLQNMAKVERLIKENAIDCQLNKNINFYSKHIYTKNPQDDPFKERTITDSKGQKRVIELYDKDFSEQCNFQLCNYTCKSIPDTKVSIDRSTFNIKFAEDDIILIKEYIKSLFTDKYVLSINEIIEAVHILLNIDLEDIEDEDNNNKFIYTAINELIKNKDLVHDRYRRKGYIIERYDYYIFQPIEVLDENIPVKYRYLPNKVLVKSIKLDDISIPNYNITRQQRKQAKKLITVKNTSIIDDNYFKKILREKRIEIKTYVSKAYSKYQKLLYLYPILPNLKKITKYLFQDYIETRTNIEINDLIMYILDNPPTDTLLRSEDVYNFCTYDNTSKSSDDHGEIHAINTIKHEIIDYYYVPSWVNSDKYSYIIDEGHVDPTKKNHNAKIIGLNWYYKESKQRVYLLNSHNPSLEEDSGYYIVPPGQLSKYKHLELNALEENTSGIYGYQESKKNLFKFHLINKLDGKYNKDMDISKKTQRRGAVCGTAKGAKNKPELLDLINTIILSMGISQNIYNPKAKSGIPKKTDTKDFRNNRKANLCEEIEVLLRHRDSRDFYNYNDKFKGGDDKFKKVSQGHRYFYRLLEKRVIDATPDED